MVKLEQESSENPLNHNARILDNCQVQCRPSQGNTAIHITDMRTLLKGSGTTALRHLCSIADLVGTPLDLIAKGYADTPTRVLKRWYNENGFVASGIGSDEDGWRMQREPKLIIKLRGFGKRVIPMHDDHDDDDDHLYEAKIIRSETAQVWKNPSGRDLIQIVARLGHDLRGLITGDDVYVWDAMLALHDKMANELGITHAFAFYVSHDEHLPSEWERDGAFDGLVGDLKIYVNKWFMLNFHKCHAYMAMKRVRGQ